MRKIKKLSPPSYLLNLANIALQKARMPHFTSARLDEALVGLDVAKELAEGLLFLDFYSRAVVPGF
jgi:hypothetical protein